MAEPTTFRRSEDGGVLTVTLTRDAQLNAVSPGSPVRSGTGLPGPASRAPQPGQHTDVIVGELGNGPQDIAELRSGGVVA